MFIAAMRRLNAIAEANERSIMNQTGTEVQMVRRYIWYGGGFRENSAGNLGL
jgi:hypothetical protein